MYNFFPNVFEPGAFFDILQLDEDLKTRPSGLDCFCDDRIFCSSSSILCPSLHAAICAHCFLKSWLLESWLCVRARSLLLWKCVCFLTWHAASLPFWSCRNPGLGAVPPAAQAVMDRPGSPRGSFSEGLQRQPGQKCVTRGDFSMGREIDMTLPHMNKKKRGLRSRLRL